MLHVRRVLSLGLVGGVVACGVEISGGSVQDNTASSSSGASGSTSSGASGGSSSGSSSSSASSSSGSADGGDDGGDAAVAPRDAASDAPVQDKWRCAPTTGKATFKGGARFVNCTTDQVGQCAPVGFSANSNCDSPGKKLRTCTSLCLDSMGESSYSYNNVCTCAP